VTDTNNNRRQYQRIPFIAEVLMTKNGKSWPCGLLDISLKGMLLLAPSDVKPDMKATYDVELVLGEGAAIQMAARISHVRDDHWGVHWENINLEGLTHLRRLLELNLVDPAEMHRELAELG
jgi:PilZ domain